MSLRSLVGLAAFMRTFGPNGGLTIIGIPLGLANLKLIPVSLTPFGREIVDVEEAERLGLEGQVAVPARRS